MNALRHKVPCILQHFCADQNGRSGSISCDFILNRRGVDDHLRHWVFHFRRFQNSHAIVGDHGASIIIDQKFIQPTWTKRRAHGSSQSQSSLNVLLKRTSTGRPVGVLQDWNIAHSTATRLLDIRSTLDTVKSSPFNLRRLQRLRSRHRPRRRHQR